MHPTQATAKVAESRRAADSLFGSDEEGPDSFLFLNIMAIASLSLSLSLCVCVCVCVYICVCV